MEVEEKRAFLRLQLTQALHTPERITCECERDIPIRYMYKCLYCGIWRCQTCAEKHFGVTREEYRIAHPEEY